MAENPFAPWTDAAMLHDASEKVRKEIDSEIINENMRQMGSQYRIVDGYIRWMAAQMAMPPSKPIETRGLKKFGRNIRRFQ